MNKDVIVEILREIHYTEQQAHSVASELILIDGQLIPMLEKWAYKKIESDVIVGDFSLMELKGKYKMTYPAALLTMDWLIKDPVTAKNCIIKGLK